MFNFLYNIWKQYVIHDSETVSSFELCRLATNESLTGSSPTMDKRNRGYVGKDFFRFVYLW